MHEVKQNALIENSYLLSIGITKFVPREQLVFQALVLKKRKHKRGNDICICPVACTACCFSIFGAV